MSFNLKYEYTFKQLKIIKALALTKSLKKAAIFLNFSRYNLIKHLNILEKNLKIKIFNRSKKFYELTEDGKIFYKYTNRILTLYEENYRILNLSKIYTSRIIELNIGISDEIALNGNCFISKLLTLIKVQYYPSVKFNIKLYSINLFKLNSIILYKLDFVFLHKLNEVRLDRKKLIIKPILKDEIILILPKNHKILKHNKKNIYKYDLYNLEFIKLSKNSVIQHSINKKLNRKKVNWKKFKINLETNSIDSLKLAVRSGLGVAFVPYLAVETELKFNLFTTIRVQDLSLQQNLSIIKLQTSKKSLGYKFFNKIFLSLLCNINKPVEHY